MRILFYGQSITEQKWSATVADYIRSTYPSANLLIENRAIGGHSAQLLVKTAEADLYPFQPDLVIFHVYGSHKDYETIIRSIRQKTTADILMATDHIVADQELQEDESERTLLPPPLDTPLQYVYRLARLHPITTANFSTWMNFSFLPRTARKYDAELADVRRQWKNYLIVNHLKAAQLLRDDVHLNRQGEYLMAEIVKAFLNPSLILQDGAPDLRIAEIRPDKDMIRTTGKWTLQFNGNRVDGVVAGPLGAPIDISIDGKPPSAHPEIYGFTRASPYTGTNWPSLLRVQHGPTPLLPETWTATIRHADAELRKFDFDVAGSRSGADGSGTSTQRFVSTSGRVVIDPGDWNLAYARATFLRPPASDFRVTWDGVAYGADHWSPPPDRADTPVEKIWVQGLSNGTHTLVLSGPELGKILSLRVHKPPLQE